VFVGYGIEEPAEGWNDYEGMDVSGKIALMVAGMPTKDGRPVLSEEKNKLHGNLMESARNQSLWAINHRVAGVIMVLDSTTAKMWSQLAPMSEQPAGLKTYFDEGVLDDHFGGSDEVVFCMRGIPAVLITSGYNHPDYHKESDDPDKKL
jgi:hypothetical protein